MTPLPLQTFGKAYAQGGDMIQKVVLRNAAPP